MIARLINDACHKFCLADWLEVNQFLGYFWRELWVERTIENLKASFASCQSNLSLLLRRHEFGEFEQGYPQTCIEKHYCACIFVFQ